jgi:hypothetical protein
VCKNVMEELLSSLLSMGIGQADPILPVQQPASLSTESAAANLAAEAAAESDTEIDDGVEELEIKDLSLTAEQTLVVQQVKVNDAQGSLKVTYPSRVDLQSETFRVVRDYE